MPIIAVNTWLVRSFTHQYEIKNLLPQVPLKIANARVTDKLYFDIFDQPTYGVIHASMDPFGLVSFAIESDAKDIEGMSLAFEKEVGDLFVEKIMGSIQKVSYSQIKKNIMPLSFHRVILSKNFKPEGVPETKAGSLSLYYDPQKICSEGFVVYVRGSEDPQLLSALDHFSYIVLVRNYIGRMVSIMSDLYRKADGVLEEMDKLSEDASKDQLKSLKKSIVDTDFIKRECAETYGKIEQANKNFEHKEKAYMKGKFTGDADALVKALNIENAFEELKCDADYLLPLWRDVLIKNLENLTSAVKSRIAFQESLEVKKEQKEVRLLRHITILSLAAAVIKLGSTPTFKLKDLAIYSVLAVLLSALVLFIVEYYSGALSIARKRREQ